MIERSFAFGEDASLIGTLCLPDFATAAALQPGQSRVGVVLFNAGLVHRVGPHRLYVKLARALAQQGTPSIRFDLHGMGDSARPRGERPHREQVVDDLRAAMDALRDAAGLDRFALLGFCSGAMQAMDAAQAEPRVARIVLYDGFALPTRKARWRFLLLRLRARGVGPQVLARVLRRAWSQLLVGLGRARQAHAEAASDLPELSDIAIRLGQLGARGVDVLVLNAGADHSLVNYPQQAHQALVAAGMPARAARCDYLDDVDHVLTPRPAQQCFIDWACKHLAAPLGPLGSER